MMKRSVRGMAKVSVVWMIVMVVAFLAAIVMFFINNGELDNQIKRAEEATKAQKAAEDSRGQAVKDLVELSAKLGYYNAASGGNRSDVATVTTALAGLKESVPDIDPSVKTFEAAMPLIVQRIKTLNERVASLDADIKAKAAEIDTAQKNVRDIGEKSTTDLADLRRQLADSEQQKQDLQAGYEKQIAEVREQFKSANTKVTEANTKIAEEKRRTDNEKDTLQTRMAEMGRKLNPFVKEPEAADGKILSVSKDLSLGWINLGAKNRLPVGTRFRIVSGAVGSNRIKGMAEVTKVEGDMAEVTFADQRDPFDPPTAGDIVYNPVYDPSTPRNAILLGSFTGQFTQDKLEGLLASMGISVQKKFDKSTDLVIVGQEMYTDENKQPVETPIQPTDLPVYKEAVAQGVQVVLLKDLRGYFRF